MRPRSPASSKKPLFAGLLPLLALTFTVATPVTSSERAASGGRMAVDPGQGHLAKASSQLLRARELAVEAASAAGTGTAEPGVAKEAVRPQVEIKLSSLTPELLASLEQRGLEVESANLDYARAYGRIDPARLAEITVLPEVQIVRPRPRVGSRAGSALSQADATMNADDARTAAGIDGSGVTVGILSDSLNSALGGTASGGACTCATPSSTCLNLVNGMANQTSGDLPGGIQLLDDCTAGSPNCDFLSDEGAALGELMFDVAPGADFMFHSAFNSPADFASGITELANCGADLIVDDVFWTNQPFFQDGEIALAAQAAVDAGVPFFSAAGNDATFGINDAFADSDPMDGTEALPDGKDFHDFGGGDVFAEISIPADCELFAELQWSEPFENGPGIGATSDLDLYLLATAAAPSTTGGTNILASSTNPQGCGIPAATTGNPDEAITYLNTTGATDTVFLAIDHFCGDKNLDLRVVTISFNCNTTVAPWDFEDGEAMESSIFVDSQIFGHPAAAGVVAVAASFFREIDTGGTLDPPGGQLDVEPYSSLGGALPFYFDGGGLPLFSPPPGTPGSGAGARPGTRDGPPPKETRDKPDVTGPDGTNNTFFGADIDDFFEPPGDTDPNFFGTSAAAPNSAAVAALILELTAENITPEGLSAVMRSTTLDMEIPGFDFLSGFGFTDAHRSVNALNSSALPLVDDLFLDLDGGSFLETPNPVSLQKIQAKKTLTAGDGNYDGVCFDAPEGIFTDGFESGDTMAWTDSTP